MRIVEKHPDYFLCSFLFKEDVRASHSRLNEVQEDPAVVAFFKRTKSPFISERLTKEEDVEWEKIHKNWAMACAREMEDKHPVQWLISILCNTKRQQQAFRWPKHLVRDTIM